LKKLDLDKASGNMKGVLTAAVGPSDNIHLRLDDHTSAPSEGVWSESAPLVVGAVGDVGYRQFHWETPVDTDDARFVSARWRIYDDGLALFNGEFVAHGGGLDGGARLGHRIELRAVDGALLCALQAAFFVRRGALVGAFASNAQIDCKPLMRHADDLAKIQRGLWTYE
jgi:hypothetical protein